MVFVGSIPRLGKELLSFFCLAVRENKNVRFFLSCIKKIEFRILKLKKYNKKIITPIAAQWDSVRELALYGLDLEC